MTRGVNPCEIKGDELMHDVLLSDFNVFVAFSFCFSFRNQLLYSSLLRYVMLDEIFLGVILKSHSFV